MTAHHNEVDDEARRQALDAIRDAVQAWSNLLADDSDEAAVVTNLLVVWEETSYDEDGRPCREPIYAVTGPMATPASSLGLAVWAKAKLLDDLVG